MVLRQDDNGNVFEVKRFADESAANEVAVAMEAKGHKQIYWVERLADHARKKDHLNDLETGAQISRF